MFLLALAGLNLFANADNGKIKKVELEKRVPTTGVKVEKVTPDLQQWQVVYHCNGTYVTVCCFNTELEAAGYSTTHWSNQICP